MSLRLTPGQELAASATGANLLVSAAAGAGKTSTLAERTLRLLLDLRPPAELDHLLIVTFTRAAAREMKDRVARKLREALDANPQDERLRRQVALLDIAPIQTLDAFCAQVVRENFHALDTPPGFEVLDEDEAGLLWSETLEEVFESHYLDEGARGREFRALVEAYGGRRDDQGLAREARRIAGFLRTAADPEAWKREALARLEEVARCQPAALGRTELGARFAAALRGRIEPAIASARRFIEEMRRAGLGGMAHTPFAEGLLGALCEAAERLRAGDLERWAEPLPRDAEELKFPRRNARPPGESKELFDSLKERWLVPARDTAKALARFEARWSAAEWIQGAASTLPLAARMLALTDEAIAAFEQEKRRRGALDFLDIKRLALRALAESGSESGGPLRPSQIAAQYRDRFDFVLVDEFQDINELDGAILNLVSRQEDGPGGATGRRPNLFAVGDVKQSVYGFRLAEPEIFLERYRRSTPLAPGAPQPPGATDTRVNLSSNFRCLAPVIETVNATFERLMDEGLGGLPYGEEARLIAARRDPPAEPPSGAPTLDPAQTLTEFLLLEAQIPKEDAAAGEGEASPREEPEAQPDAASGAEESEAEETARIEREGYALAARLREIVFGGGQSGDPPLRVFAPPVGQPGAAPQWRRAAWGDIVILMRSMTRATELADALERAGAPVIPPPGGSLLETLEGRDLLSALRVLDNPCQEIPLAAWLRSPMQRFNADDLARIRLGAEEGDDFFRAFERRATGAEFPGGAADSSEAAAREDLNRRCREALDRLNRWRALARRLPVADLLDRILEETAYGDYARALPGGARREAHIQAFRARAAQFGGFTRQGLARFLRFLDHLEREGAAPAAEASSAENADAIRILSIHKSKGLEFPIVVVANLGAPFNLIDLSAPMIADRRHGLGLMAGAGRRAALLPSLAHEVIKRERRMAQLAEEMRLLYVAMTRARDHLILCGSAEGAANRFAKWREAGPHDGPLPLEERAAARTFLDWLGPALARRALLEGEPPGGAAPVLRARILESAPAPPATVAPGNPLTQEGDSAADAAPPPAWEPAARAALLRAAREPEPAPPPALRAKMSVSEIKRLWDAAVEPEEAPWRDLNIAQEGEFLYDLSSVEGKTGGAAVQRGRLTHLALQHLDFARAATPGAIAAQIEERIAAGRLPAAAHEAVDIEAIARFFRGPEGARLAAWPPGAIFREVPFTAWIRAEEALPELSPEERRRWGAERVILQGVADCVARGAEGLWILDWKTDAVRGEALEKRARAYETQLRLYARALSEVYDAPARRATLVFLAAGETREVPLDSPGES